MRHCTICGEEIRLGLQYCLNCGAGVSGDSAVSLVGNAVPAAGVRYPGERAKLDEAADSAKTVALPLDNGEDVDASGASDLQIQAEQDNEPWDGGAVEPLAPEQDELYVSKDALDSPSSSISEDVVETPTLEAQDAAEDPMPDAKPSDAGQLKAAESDAGAEAPLVAASAQQSVLLMRRRTGERISVVCPAVVGKGSNADCRILDNPAISRQHALIEQDGQGFVLSNLSKTNGTWARGCKLALHSRIAIRPGDILVFADEEFEFRVDGGTLENGV